MSEDEGDREELLMLSGEEGVRGEDDLHNVEWRGGEGVRMNYTMLNGEERWEKGVAWGS